MSSGGVTALAISAEPPLTPVAGKLTLTESSARRARGKDFTENFIFQLNPLNAPKASARRTTASLRQLAALIIGFKLGNGVTVARLALNQLV